MEGKREGGSKGTGRKGKGSEGGRDGVLEL